MWYNAVNNKATALRQQPVAWPNLTWRSDMGIIPSSPGVYKITCTTTNKAYIGSTTDLRKRWYWHKGDLRKGRHHNRYLQNAWNKHGAECFTFEVLEMVMFAEHLHEREQYWLDHYRTYDPKRGFNAGKVAQAPWLGRSHSEETRQKLSASAKRQMGAEQLATLQGHAAEWHGSSEGLAWHSEHAKRTWRDRQSTIKTCEMCGASYETLVPHHARFCSDHCKNKSRDRAGLNDEERVCCACGMVYRTNKYGRSKFCSARCVTRGRRRGDDGTFI